MGDEELEGPRVRLRPPAGADVEILFRWYEDPELSAPFDRFVSDSREAFAEELRSSPEDPASLAPRFVIQRRSDGAVVGCLGHYRAHPVLTLVDIWYLVGDPTARGGGLGSEAVGLLVTHLFRGSAVERVGATSDVENVASMRLLEKLGFRREGTIRSALYHHARWHDVGLFGVTRSEWAARRVPG